MALPTFPRARRNPCFTVLRRVANLPYIAGGNVPGAWRAHKEMCIRWHREIASPRAPFGESNQCHFPPPAPNGVI
jgi:hypothetical protein